MVEKIVQMVGREREERVEKRVEKRGESSGKRSDERSDERSCATLDPTNLRNAVSQQELPVRVYPVRVDTYALAIKSTTTARLLLLLLQNHKSKIMRFDGQFVIQAHIYSSFTCKIF